MLVEIRRRLLSHAKVHPDPARVRFVGFGAYSLDVEITSYVSTSDWAEFLAVREDLCAARGDARRSIGGRDVSWISWLRRVLEVEPDFPPGRRSTSRARVGGGRWAALEASLATRREVRAPVVAPGRLIVAHHAGLDLAEAHRAQSRRRNSEVH